MTDEAVEAQRGVLSQGLCEQVGGGSETQISNSRLSGRSPSCTFPMPQGVLRVPCPRGRYPCSLTLGGRPGICQKLWEDWLELLRAAGGLS